MNDEKIKKEYVKKQKQTRPHTCHWPGCNKQVPSAMWGCKPHWFKLPKKLRDRIWDAYVPGQEERMDPSDKYLAVADEVQQWISAKSQNDIIRQSPAGDALRELHPGIDL